MNPDADAKGAAPRRSERKRLGRTIDPSNSLLVHDVKNLSFRLGLLLQNLESHYDDPVFKKSVVEVISDTVARMDRIVRRCRDRHGDVMVKIPVDVNEILHGVLDALPASHQRRQGLLIEESYSRVPEIWGDAEFLREAFAILIQNALEAMDETGGRLCVSTDVASSRAGKRKILVEIADTGTGMPAEFARTSLFVPFVTTKEHGLGLGLYTCRRIVTLHEGSLRLWSREGKGTRARVTFNVD